MIAASFRLLSSGEAAVRRGGGRSRRRAATKSGQQQEGRIGWPRAADDRTRRPRRAPRTIVVAGRATDADDSGAAVRATNLPTVALLCTFGFGPPLRVVPGQRALGFQLVQEGRLREDTPLRPAISPIPSLLAWTRCRSLEVN